MSSNSKKSNKEENLQPQRLRIPVIRADYNAENGLGPRTMDLGDNTVSEVEPQNVKYMDEQIAVLDRKIQMAEKEGVLKKAIEKRDGTPNPTEDPAIMKAAGDLLKTSAEASKITMDTIRQQATGPQKIEETAVATLGSITNQLVADKLHQGSQPTGATTDQIIVAKLIDVLGNLATRGAGGDSGMIKYVDAKVDTMNKEITDVKNLLSQFAGSREQYNNPEVWLKQLSSIKQSLDTFNEPRTPGGELTPQITLELKRIDLQLEKMREDHDIAMKEYDRKWNLMTEKFTFDKSMQLLDRKDKADRSKQMTQVLSRVGENVVAAIGGAGGAQGQQSTFNPETQIGVRCGQCGFEFVVPTTQTDIVCPKCGVNLKPPTQGPSST